MNLVILVAAIAPVVLIFGLGYLAGKYKDFDHDQAIGFSHFALKYALPVALFLSMASFKCDLLLQQGPLVVVMIIGYSLFFGVSYLVLCMMTRDRLTAVLLGYAVSSTAAPIYGDTVGGGVVGLTAVVTNLLQVSVVIYLLESASRSETSRPSLARTLGKTIKNPLVWAPVLGTIVSLSGLTMPPVSVSVLKPLAVCAPGAAIFACGLALASYSLNLRSRTVILGSLVCVVLQPAVFFVALKAWGLKSAMAKAAFVASAMPTSTPSALFAQQYGKCEVETASIMLLTTLGMVVVIPATVAICEWI
ncbi:AEC family transporter [Acetobacter pasteurianus]|uniref:AEC family transporter n=1 Tax=Acetobacter pasteurianus TaxID=438 RepID=UPI000F58C573|nr:AEC family transporter [Acetobacter pasteurianus]GCD56378.1 transporter [Acetobacter pasteurianus NBRC 3222]